MDDLEKTRQYLRDFKIPVTDLLSQCSQQIPNIIDKLINDCVILHGKVDSLTTEKQSYQKQVVSLREEIKVLKSEPSKIEK